MAGWPKLRRQVNWFMVGLVITVQLAGAALQDGGQAPETDFLEFLGAWHTEDGKWMDPFQIDQMPTLETSDRGKNSPDREFRGRSRKKRFEQERSPSQENDPPSERQRSEQ